jgi:type I restriction enzyme S subunit
MRKYQSYKRTCIEWVEEIPISWEETKLKYVGNLYGGLTGKSGEDFKQVDNPNNKPYIPYTNIFRNTYISKSHVDYVVLNDGENQNKVEKFDLFFLMSSETYQDLGKSCILIDDIDELYLNSFCKGFRVNRNDISPLFLNYQLLGSVHKELISIEGRGFTRINLRQDRLNETPIFLPPLKEQLQIVQFLDEKTELIDKLISTKERKITLLKEQRTSLINQVVTKGLNPNVKMKDSCVEWIGEIPEMWLMGKIKFLSEIISKGTTPSTVGREVLEVGNIFYVKVENIKEGYVGVPPSYFIDEETDKILSRSSLKENDILVVITGSTIGKVVILPKEFTPSNTNQGISFVRLKNKSNVRFVWYWLSTEIIQDRIKVVCTQSTQPNLSMEDLGNFSIPLPSELEQLQIVVYLDSKTKEIDDLVKLEQKKIDLLKQYRQSLISEVVTGKIKVTK